MAVRHRDLRCGTTRSFAPALRHELLQHGQPREEILPPGSCSGDRRSRRAAAPRALRRARRARRGRARGRTSRAPRAARCPTRIRPSGRAFAARARTSAGAASRRRRPRSRGSRTKASSTPPPRGDSAAAPPRGSGSRRRSRDAGSRGSARGAACPRAARFWSRRAGQSPRPARRARTSAIPEREDAAARRCVLWSSLACGSLRETCRRLRAAHAPGVERRAIGGLRRPREVDVRAGPIRSGHPIVDVVGVARAVRGARGKSREAQHQLRDREPRESRDERDPRESARARARSSPSRCVRHAASRQNQSVDERDGLSGGGCRSRRTRRRAREPPVGTPRPRRAARSPDPPGCGARCRRTACRACGSTRSPCSRPSGCTGA